MPENLRKYRLPPKCGATRSWYRRCHIAIIPVGVLPRRARSKTGRPLSRWRRRTLPVLCRITLLGKKASLRSRFAVFVAIVQLILFFGHFSIYETWRYFSAPADPALTTFLRALLVVLSVTFVPASVLAFRYNNILLRAFYTLASIWLGLLNFLFLASALYWTTLAAAAVLRLHLSQPALGYSLFALAVLVSLYGFVNAAATRVRRIHVALPRLPKAWIGRTAAFVSDTHLGHVRGYAFISRIVAMLRQLRPDIIFIAGDVFDGTKVEPNHLAAPWSNLTPPLGKFFVTGNHEEFSDSSQYVDALRRSGVRVLLNESVTVDSLQLIGVTYSTLAHPESFRSALQAAAAGSNGASILLAHAPHSLSIAEEMGVSLQLSGHTHRGQTFPFTWFTSRIFGKFTYGLHQHGALRVYTSSGAGTWGPPMRVGTRPEIVLIRFEQTQTVS